MKFIFLIFLFVALLSGCSQKSKPKMIQSSLKLEKDIYRFSEKMSNGDTIYLNASIGACLDQSMENNIITKENDSVFIQSKIEGTPSATEAISLPKTFYNWVKTDTLNFENLFYSLRGNITKPKKHIQNTFQVIYKKDTIEFVCKNLMDHLDKTAYYKQIKERIYPATYQNLFRITYIAPNDRN
jgi:hypothetical protein